MFVGARVRDSDDSDITRILNPGRAFDRAHEPAFQPGPARQAGRFSAMHFRPAGCVSGGARNPIRRHVP